MGLLTEMVRAVIFEGAPIPQEDPNTLLRHAAAEERSARARKRRVSSPHKRKKPAHSSQPILSALQRKNAESRERIRLAELASLGRSPED